MDRGMVVEVGGVDEGADDGTGATEQLWSALDSLGAQTDPDATIERICNALGRNAQVNKRIRDWGHTPLSFVCFKCTERDRNGVFVLGLLLEHGADPNIQDDYGRVPLHYCSMSTDSGMAQVLLSQGADPRIKDKDGWDVLEKAQKWNTNNRYSSYISLLQRSLRGDGIAALLLAERPQNQRAPIYKAYFRHYLCEYQLLPLIARYMV